MNEVGFTWGV